VELRFEIITCAKPRRYAGPETPLTLWNLWNPPRKCPVDPEWMEQRRLDALGCTWPYSAAACPVEAQIRNIKYASISLQLSRVTSSVSLWITLCIVLESLRGFCSMSRMFTREKQRPANHISPAFQSTLSGKRRHITDVKVTGTCTSSPTAQLNSMTLPPDICITRSLYGDTDCGREGGPQGPSLGPEGIPLH
jgi:hypothetical protein